MLLTLCPFEGTIRDLIFDPIAYQDEATEPFVPLQIFKRNFLWKISDNRLQLLHQLDFFAIFHSALAATSRAIPRDGQTRGSPLRVTP